MKEKFKKFIFTLFSLILISFTLKAFFDVKVVYASDNTSSNFISKVSKDYTNKFCNSIAFGLSKNSAMKFSKEENKKQFEKKKQMKIIDNELLAEEIAISVIETCGYQINMTGQKGIEDFKTFYLSENESH